MATINISDLTNGTLNNNNEWVGTGVFDVLVSVVNKNIEGQYNLQRITGSDYAGVYVSALQAAMAEALKFVTSKQVLENQIDIGKQEYAEMLDKWEIQKDILANQLSMSNVDTANKAAMVAKDLTIKDKQIATADADIEFNISKKTIMEQTRKDNIRTKAAEQFAEFLKYISAANVVPGQEDFKNMRKLITAVNGGIANPDIVATLVDGTQDYRTP